MKKEIQLSINPNMGKIYKYFPYLSSFDEATKAKMVASWGKINNSDYQFLHATFSSRKLKASLDDVAYLYNYLKFIHRVKNSDFNLEAEKADKGAKELWPFFQMMEQNKLRAISLQTKDYKTIKFTTEYSVNLFYEIFSHSIKSLSGMVYAKNYLLAMRQSGYLEKILKRRPGNKIDYTGTVLIQAVSSFKSYLLAEMDTFGNKRASPYTIIGEMLARVAFIDVFPDDGSYNNANDYYNKKARYYDLDITLKNTLNIKDELFPPHYFIQLNENLI